MMKLTSKFQFTHPGKGATLEHRIGFGGSGVSIHAPWEGCDVIIIISKCYYGVSIHAPWEGCDWC